MTTLKILFDIGWLVFLGIIGAMLVATHWWISMVLWILAPAPMSYDIYKHTDL